MIRIEDIPKHFEPQEAEKRIYDYWMENKLFHARIDKNKKPYTIVMPPPNITGQLHMGHALDNTLQDILIRWRRMQGYSALWMPGSDHASIATEARIVEAMAKEGITKDDLGREAFLERAWEWKELYGGLIVDQLKRLGSSCDWDRERFTMDEGLSDAVTHVFISLYEKDLIYRGERIINWCPTCLTSISDAEVEHEESEGFFWHIKYPYEKGEGHVTVATTRPETMLGDTAVAVNPEDERYSALIGKNLILPLTGRTIPVVADSYVDRDFGTGAVKITPAHDPNDFEIGLRHDLKILNVMTEDAKMNENAGVFAGMDRYEARKKIVKALEEEGLIEKIEAHQHNIGHCYRCSTVVEPRVSLEWFVKMQPLAEPAIKAVREGEVKFVPERFDKIYFNWMENIRDWCISRQLWWGHRIPAYYCSDCMHIHVSASKPESCAECGNSLLVRDEGTLDTWFSSALWPFSTLGWPEATEDFKYFYPTDVLVTGYDIIFFWVARMIFSALEHTGKVPFDHVLIHGIIRDELGRKMSKSLNNGIDPLEVIDEHGADALRFSLINGNSPGNDQRFLSQRVDTGRNFANKLWNSFRFLVMNLRDGDVLQSALDSVKLQAEDKWILTRLNVTIEEVTANLERFELGVALTKLYNFVWEEYCDWYIEMVKPRLSDQAGEDRKSALYVLHHVLTASLKLLHPYMPYITEEMYMILNGGSESIMVSAWPTADPALNFPDDVEKIAILMEAITKIRNIRAERKISHRQKINLIVLTYDSKIEDAFRTGGPFISRLANLESFSLIKDESFIPENTVSAVMAGGQLHIPLSDVTDFEEEISRLEAELKKNQENIARLTSKLDNPGFVEKAPEQVVMKEREKLADAIDIASSLKQQLEKIKEISH